MRAGCVRHACVQAEHQACNCLGQQGGSTLLFVLYWGSERCECSCVLCSLHVFDVSRQRAKSDLKPLHMHSHSMEGFAVDWSSVKAGRLATGDCNKKIHVWEPQVRGCGGRWCWVC